MSYILEALKKLEQKREQEESRKGVTFSLETAKKQAKRRIWPYPVAAVLLLNAGVAIWVITGTGVKPAPVIGPKVSRVNEKSPSVATPARTPAQPEPKAAATPAQPERESTSPRTATAERVKPEPEPRREMTAPLPAQPLNRKEKPVIPAEPRPPRERQSVAAEPAFTVKELPPFIRNDLPEFKVSGHAYSPQPQNRVTRINDRILQEGEELNAGVRVEEIVPDGVILSYQGYRFRIPVTLNR